MTTAKAIGDVFGGLLESTEEQIMVSAKFIRIRFMVQIDKPLRRGIILAVGIEKFGRR